MNEPVYFTVYRYRGVMIRTYILHGVHYAHYRTNRDAEFSKVRSPSWLGVRMLAERRIHEQLRGGLTIR